MSEISELMRKDIHGHEISRMIQENMELKLDNEKLLRKLKEITFENQRLKQQMNYLFIRNT